MHTPPPGGRVRRASLPTALLPAGLLLVLAGFWEFAARYLGVPPYILPAPATIARTLLTRWPDTLQSATWVTGQEILLGFAVALASGLGVGAALHASSIARQALYPLLIGSQTIPVIVLGPVLAIIFGYTIVPKLVLVALVCFFPVIVNTADGLSGADPELLRLMRTLYGTRWSVFRRVEFPSALPSIFSGIRLAATYAAIGAVFGEYAGSSDGLGFVMIQATPQLQTALVFAAITLLSAMSIALFGLVSIAERLLIPWNQTGQER